MQNRLLLMALILTIGPGAVSAQKLTTTTDSCVEIPDLGKHPDGSPVLPALVGRVLDFDGHSPLVGAHLQITGTRFGTFSDRSGEYRLVFDPRTIDWCRKQHVQVIAPGHSDAMFALVVVGPGVRIADIILRKH
jgi:hypothetical protein